MTFDSVPPAFVNSQTCIREQEIALARSDILSSERYYPKTRFFGSKRKLLSWYEEIFEKLSFHSVLDVFGGTGTVSLMFRYMGKSVTYNDALRFNAICAKAVLSGPYSTDIIQKANSVIEAIVPSPGFITHRFKGLYYKDHENRWLDGAHLLLSRFPSGNLKHLLLYAITQSCLMKRPFNLFHRANLDIRLNVPANTTFGNVTTWNKSFSDLCKQNINELLKLPQIKLNGARVLKPQDASEVLGSYDLVFIDPPYVPSSRHTDDYLRLYHFLEGFVNYENWGKRINTALQTKALESQKHIRDWNNKSSFLARLDELLDRHRDSICVLAYVEDAYPSRQYLRRMFSRHFGSVKTHSRVHKHVLCTKVKREILVIGGKEI